MLNIDEALPLLETRLQQGRFSAGEPDVGVAWNVFRAFALTQVDAQHDEIVFERSEQPDKGGVARSAWTVMRQLTPDDGAPETLRLTFFFERRPGDTETPAIERSGDHPSVDAFLEHLESLSAFRDGLERAAPLSMELTQDESVARRG